MVPAWEMCSEGLEFEAASSSYQDHLGLEYVRMGISMNIYPLVMTNIAMENCPFLDGLPMKIAWAIYTMANCY